jgi:circadian clock protein KaiB
MTEKKRRRQPGAKKGDVHEENFWELKLYIAGKTRKGSAAIQNLKDICEEHLKGRYRITVIDLRERPEIAFKEQIVVTPTVIRELPPPVRKIIGDLSRKEKVLVGLDILARTVGEVAHA